MAAALTELRMVEHYTVNELAAILKVSPDTVRRRMKEIRGLRVSYVGRLLRIPEDQALRILKRVKDYSKKK